MFGLGPSRETRAFGTTWRKDRKKASCFWILRNVHVKLKFKESNSKPSISGNGAVHKYCKKHFLAARSKTARKQLVKNTAARCPLWDLSGAMTTPPEAGEFRCAMVNHCHSLHGHGKAGVSPVGNLQKLTNKVTSNQCEDSSCQKFSIDSFSIGSNTRKSRRLSWIVS